MCRPCMSARTASMSDQCTRRPSFRPVSPNTKPASAPSRLEGAGRHAAEFLPHQQDRGRHALGEAGAPGRFLQAHGSRALVVCGEFADDDSVGEGYVLHSGPRVLSRVDLQFRRGCASCASSQPSSRVVAASSTAACRSPVRPVSPPPAPYDVVITNGRIVDGAGNAWFWGDVGVRGDRIARIAPRGSLAQRLPARRIDAHGFVVSPGFIDIQAQSYDNFMTGDGRALSMVTQGITTAILGEGDTPAPVNGKLLAPSPTPPRTAIAAALHGAARLWRVARLHAAPRPLGERRVVPRLGNGARLRERRVDVGVHAPPSSTRCARWSAAR